MIDLLPLESRREPKRSGRVRRGAHKPLAIRWFGMTALAGHLRHLLAVAAASNQLDLRDWMRPEEAAGLLNRVCQVLGASASGGALTERLGREVWIDFVADTGDDHDVSLAVGRMLFAEYALSGDQPRRLPRGDILVFGGDVAYPASTAYETERRLLRPWNHVLHGKVDDGRRRIVLGIPGNHDWYDGLDGFGRLFRRKVEESFLREDRDRPSELVRRFGHEGARRVGLVARELHLDEVGGLASQILSIGQFVRAFFKGVSVRRRRRLTLRGYEPIQEASYFAFPLAKGLEMWGVDR